MRIRTVAGASRSGPIVHRSYTFFMRAVSTTIDIAASFNTMANYLAAAMFAFGSECVNGAFEAIKVSRDAVVNDFQRLVIFVSTNFTLHNTSSWIVLRIPCRA